MENIYQNKIRINVIIAFLLCFISPLATSASSLNVGAQKAAPKEAYLFVQSASKAKIEVNKNDANTYTLTLNNIPEFVTYFADRPKRNAGTIPLEQFLKLWQYQGHDSFKTDPPNAVLSAVKMGFSSADAVSSFTIELLDPEYDAASKTLNFTVIPLKGEINPLPTDAVLHHVILFIDDACLSCWN